MLGIADDRNTDPDHRLGMSEETRPAIISHSTASPQERFRRLGYQTACNDPRTLQVPLTIPRETHIILVGEIKRGDGSQILRL